MKINFDSVIHLLHEAGHGSLATYSTHVPGYPFSSILPFALDEQHCPLLLISGLAEHTKNLLADSRASFLVHSEIGHNILMAERVTIVGDVKPVKPSPELVSRYLRYHPDAEQYLSLGDFTFFRLSPKRARYVAGFGQMGWLEESEWSDCKTLSLADEAQTIKESLETRSQGIRLLGIDCFGYDVEQDGKRERQRFPQAPIEVEQLGDVMKRFLLSL